MLRGTYSMEQKITVEWENEIELDSFYELLERVLSEPRSFRVLRAHVSGCLKAIDLDLPPGKISRYRVSDASFRQGLESLQSAGLVRSVPGDDRETACKTRDELWVLARTG